MAVGRFFLLLIRPLLAMHFIFAVFYALPGSPLSFESSLKKEYQSYLIRQFALDQNLSSQYFQFLKNLFLWDWGYSIGDYPRLVSELLRQAIAPSLQLGIYAFVAIIVISLSGSTMVFVVEQGKYKNHLLYAVRFLQGIPLLFLGPFLIFVFAIQLGWLPVALLETKAAYILPVLCLAYRPSLLATRLMVQELSQLANSDVARTARAKGLPQLRIVCGHLLKMAAPIYMATLFNSAVSIVGGSVIVETLFGVNGIGSLFLRSLEYRDAPLVFAITSVYCLIYLCLSLCYELSLRLLDPRIASYERTRS